MGSGKVDTGESGSSLMEVSTELGMFGSGVLFEDFGKMTSLLYEGTGVMESCSGQNISQNLSYQNRGPTTQINNK